MNSQPDRSSHAAHAAHSSHPADRRRQPTHQAGTRAPSHPDRERAVHEPPPFPVSERAVSQADGEA